MSYQWHSWFKPQLQTEIGRRSVRDIVLGMLLIVFAFGSLGVWLGFAPIVSAIIADGVIKVEASRQLIQTATGGIVKEIRVRDGEMVKAGQTLFVIHDARLDANYGVLKALLDSERAKQARLEGEARFATEITFPADLRSRRDDPQIARILEREQALFTARMANANDQMHLLRQQEQETDLERQRYNERLKAQREALALLREQMKGERTLLDKQYISRQRLLELERMEQQYIADVHEIEGELTRIQQRHNDFSLRSVAIKSGVMANATVELKDSNNRLTDLEQQLRPSQEATQKLVVTAPLTGKVFNIKVHTLGEVVGLGNTLAEVMPQQSERIIEALIPVKEIRNITIGSKAEVRFNAYNQRITPQVDAQVTYIAPDRLVDREAGKDGYVVRLKLDAKSLARAGVDEVIPGMTATVYILVGERTMLNYLFQPFIDSFDKAFRETY